MDTEAFHLRP